MTIDRVLGGVAVLLGCQLVGEVVARLLGLSIPGPVIGIVVLFAVLRIREGRPPTGVEQVADGLLAHLALLFVPAGVGIIGYGALLRREWAPVLATVVGVTALGIALTAATMAALVRRRDPVEAHGGEGPA